jgi:hypothetical protein
MAVSCASARAASGGQAWSGRAVLRIAGSSPAPRVASVPHYQIAAPISSLKFISGLFGRQVETEKLVVEKHDPSSSEVGPMIQCQQAQYQADVAN